MSSTKNNPIKRGVLFVNLASYLKKLEAIERTMPPNQRLEVPSLTELASAAGSNRNTMSRLARGKMVMLSFNLAGAIIREMRSRGFQMEIWDLVDYIGPNARPRRYIVGDDESDSPDVSEISDAGGAIPEKRSEHRL